MPNPVLVIAEAGVNHNGSLDIALKLVDAAAEAGADYVKFQTFNAKGLVTKEAATADYQKKNLNGKYDSQFEMLKKLELSKEHHHVLMDYARDKKIKFFSTAFDFDSLNFLKSLNLGLWKIPSGEITNLPYLEFIGRQGQPVIISTGMADHLEVKESIDALLKVGLKKENLTVLHCNTEYPTPFTDVNLRAMQTLGNSFGIPYGYSDHTLGIEVPIAAVALGATVIEKHFTLSRSMEGPDHVSSLEPAELKQMVTSIRNIEMSLGSSQKIVSASEAKNRGVARKSIVASGPIKKGEVFTTENLTTRRPGDGISPMKWYDLLGKTSPRDFSEDEKIVL